LKSALRAAARQHDTQRRSDKGACNQTLAWGEFQPHAIG